MFLKYPICRHVYNAKNFILPIIDYILLNLLVEDKSLILYQKEKKNISFAKSLALLKVAILDVLFYFYFMATSLSCSSNS